MPTEDEEARALAEASAGYVQARVARIIAEAVNAHSLKLAEAYPGRKVDPWIIFAAAAAGAASAAIEAMWSVCDPATTKANAGFPAMFAQMAHAIITKTEKPPGTFLLAAEKAAASLEAARQKMN